MNFVEALKQKANQTITENGALALKSTGNDLVDLFGSIGALRSREEIAIQALFAKTFVEDPLLATKLMFYARDIRGGLGERRTFRAILKMMAQIHPEIIVKNFKNINTFGRWDDFYTLVGTPCEVAMWQYISHQLKLDVQGCNAGESISLLAKWLKSPKTSSKQTSMLGRYTAKQLGLSEKEYRQTLSRLRRHIKVTETLMSAKEWSNIAYEGVPSYAMTNYRGAFERHDTERFRAYIDKVCFGVLKINASTLYPYDIVEKILYGNGYSQVLEEQWKALPDYIEGTANDVLIMADVSGSMMGRPMATAIGLAIYFAERNQGVYRDLFMTFSANPEILTIKGNTLYEKIMMVKQTPWGMNTDFEAAMELILETAIQLDIPTDQLPKSLVVISDMQFDSATRINWGANVSNWNFYDHLRERFEASGYTIPNIVFWNVDSDKDTFHASCDYKGVQLASGHSAGTFKTVLANIGKTPYEAMLATLNQPRYDCVEI